MNSTCEYIEEEFIAEDSNPNFPQPTLFHVKSINLFTSQPRQRDIVS